MARILIVEPDAKLARLYAVWLEKAGHEAAVVFTAQSAISAADTGAPDIVILEIQLTNHSGIEFLYELRSYSDWRAIPVLVLSHVPESAFVGSSRLLKERLGVRGYFYKPETQLTDLGRAIEETLARL